MTSIHVLVGSWIWSRAIILKEESHIPRRMRIIVVYT